VVLTSPFPLPLFPTYFLPQKNGSLLFAFFLSSYPHVLAVSQFSHSWWAALSQAPRWVFFFPFLEIEPVKVLFRGGSFSRPNLVPSIRTVWRTLLSPDSFTLECRLSQRFGSKKGKFSTPPRTAAKRRSFFHSIPPETSDSQLSRKPTFSLPSISPVMNNAV